MYVRTDRAQYTTVLFIGTKPPGYVPELVEHGGFRPVGRVSSVAAAVSVLREHKPDVVVLDLGSLHGLTAFVEAAEHLQGCSVVVVSALPREVALLACMAAGAAAFVGASVEPGTVARAVAAAVDGQTFVDPRSTDWLVRFALHGYQAPSQEGLSLRQSQVVQLVRLGLTNRQIAHALGVSPETVKSHLHEAMRRLGVHTRRHVGAAVDRSRGR